MYKREILLTVVTKPQQKDTKGQMEALVLKPVCFPLTNTDEKYITTVRHKPT